jgi:hypothetical protein
MLSRPRTTLTREELDRAEIPMNHILVEMKYKSEDLKTHAGIQIGFNSETLYGEGDGSHIADVAETWGIVTKVPNKLFFEPGNPKSMDWETEMDLCEEDIVFFNIMESKNSPEVICEGKTYKSIPYSDAYCCHREIWVDKWTNTKKTIVVVLNGFVLCKEVYQKPLGSLDSLSEKTIDKTRGIIAYLGDPVKQYLRPEYTHIPNLQVGQEVLFDKNAPIFYLERLSSVAKFHGTDRYWVVNRRRIAMVLK